MKCISITGWTLLIFQYRLILGQFIYSKAASACWSVSNDRNNPIPRNKNKNSPPPHHQKFQIGERIAVWVSQIWKVRRLAYRHELVNFSCDSVSCRPITYIKCSKPGCYSFSLSCSNYYGAWNETYSHSSKIVNSRALRWVERNSSRLGERNKKPWVSVDK